MVASDANSGKYELSKDADFDTEDAVVGSRSELGGHCVFAGRAFEPGERVFREDLISLVAKVRAYCDLCTEDRRALLDKFWGEEPSVRCLATAACRQGLGAGDSSADVLAAMRAEGHTGLELSEVEAVIRVWNLNAYDSALAPFACKISHSCAPNVSVRVDMQTKAIEVTACCRISKGDVLSSWYFQDTGLWWMATDVRRALFETDRGFLCACGRCRSPDKCRSFPCDACSAGIVVPEGTSASDVSSAQMWSCSSCGRRAVGEAVRLAAEADIVPRVLAELRPPKGAQRQTPEELVALDLDARARLGTLHWAVAGIALVLHFRTRSAGGILNAFSVACGCRFLGWLWGRGLQLPPASIVRTPVSLSIECAEWLAPVGSHPAESREESRDLRCIASRILTQCLLPVYDASGSTVAEVGKTAARVTALRNWLQTMRSHCGCCGLALAETDGHRGDVGTREAPASAPVPLACGRCKQVRYCSRKCQQADWKQRHRAGCLSASESLDGEAAWALLTKAS